MPRIQKLLIPRSDAISRDSKPAHVAWIDPGESYVAIDMERDQAIEAEASSFSWSSAISQYATHHELSDVVFVFCPHTSSSQRSTSSSSSSSHEVPAHRLILALRSLVFHQLFVTPTNDLAHHHQQRCFPIKIVIHKSISYDMFLPVLTFMYTNSIDDHECRPLEQMLQSLYVATLYRVDSLVVALLPMIKHKITDDDHDHDHPKSALSTLACLDQMQKQIQSLDFSKDNISLLSLEPPPVQAAMATLAPTIKRSHQHQHSNNNHRITRVWQELEITCEALIQDETKDFEEFKTLVSGCSFEEEEEEPFMSTNATCSLSRLVKLVRQRSKWPLLEAIEMQHLALVDALVHLGEPVEDEQMPTLPLARALALGHSAIVRRILGCPLSHLDSRLDDKTLEPNLPSYVHLVAMQGSVAHGRILLHHHQDIHVEAQDVFYQGKTPFHFASQQGHVELLELFFEASGLSAERKIARMLVPNAQDRDGNTALHLAKNADTLAQFMRCPKGVNVHIPNQYGQVPLHLIAMRFVMWIFIWISESVYETT